MSAESETETTETATEMRAEVELRLRVRYAETDQMKVAHHSVYLVWFEAARAEFCRARGIDYNAMEAAGYFLPIIEARCRYRAPARYDDAIIIAVRVAEMTRRTLRMAYRVIRDDTLLAEGETLQMLVGPDGRPRIFPADLTTLFS
jgi:acyl-CoA thioester hydrolase